MASLCCPNLIELIPVKADNWIWLSVSDKKMFLSLATVHLYSSLANFQKRAPHYHQLTFPLGANKCAYEVQSYLPVVRPTARLYKQFINMCDMAGDRVQCQCT